MLQTWGFLSTGHHDAAINMAIDECLIRWLEAGDIPPTLRFYGWSAPTLSVGKNQKITRAIDLDAVKRHDCEFVRRLTGGSAVLHDDELTYSLVISEADPHIPKSVTEAYYILSKGVLEGYRELGIQADYAIPKREIRKERTAVCFEETAYYEMIVAGKKISGNAQTRKSGVLLQHGSIPMSMNEHVLFDLFNFSSEALRERQRKSFQNKAITINDITKKKHTYPMLEKAFLTGFQRGLNINIEPIVLSDEQWAEIKQLSETKYRQDDWNLFSEKERVNRGKEYKEKA